MQEINTDRETEKNRKIYSIGWMLFGTYLGGPLAGTYLISQNFKQLNKEDEGANTLRIGIVATIIIFSALVFIPTSIVEQIPNAAIPAVYTAIIYWFVRKYQGTEIEEHFKNKGKKQSGWKVTGISLLSALITLAYFLGLAMSLPEEWIM